MFNSFLFLLSGVFLFSVGTSSTWAEEKSTRVVKVAAIRFQPNELTIDYPELLMNKLSAAVHLFKEKDAVDLIVLPEYSLNIVSWDPEREGLKPVWSPVRIFKFRNVYLAREINSGQSRKLVRIINAIQSFAKEHKVNIVLATIPEIIYISQNPELKENTVFNTVLVININGEIVEVRRKTGEFWPGTPRNQDRENMALDTVKKIVLETRDGINFSILPIICVETHTPKVWEKARGMKVDLIVHPLLGPGLGFNGFGNLTNRTQERLLDKRFFYLFLRSSG